ncbi:MAG: hypothetical protein RIT24_1257 [Planctomycetota bacterium]|jgi:LemA protein
MNGAVAGGLGGFLCVVAVILGIPLIWFIATYNRFARLGQLVKESWSGVDVELKRRHDLVPNLVATVKGYAQHEKETLELVVAARARAVQAGDALRERVDGESELTRSLGRLIAVAESYPELKADRHYLELQRELSLTEDRIAASRRFYNANVRELNALRIEFPSNLVAGMFGFKEERFFELDDSSERAAPSVRI